MAEFLWVPESGYDPTCLKNLQDHFKRPTTPMGEAWFMDEQRVMYTELLGDLDQIAWDRWQKILGEISSGIYCFGHRQEWDDWFYYLLGRSIPRAHEGYLGYTIENLISGFMNFYPDGVTTEPYAGFLDDVLNTLGKCMMDAQGWQNGDIMLGRLLHKPPFYVGTILGWSNVSGDFSASMFFCLKYLAAQQIPRWLESVFTIPSPHWRAQLMAWLVGAYDILYAKHPHPARFSTAEPNIEWSSSHCVKGLGDIGVQDWDIAPFIHFIPKANSDSATHTLHQLISKSLYQEWCQSFAQYDYLADDLTIVSANFAQLYLAGP